MKFGLLGMLVVFCVGVAEAIVTVTNFTVSQRSGTKLADIYYDLHSSFDGDAVVNMQVFDGTNEVAGAALTGDLGDNVSTGLSKHVVWDMAADWDGNVSSNLSVRILAMDGPERGDINATSWVEVNARWVKNIYANGDITMTDRDNDRMWTYSFTQTGSKQMTWYDANSRASSLDYAYYTDWGLADISTLQSMRSQTEFFIGWGVYQSDPCWSSSLGPYNNQARYYRFGLDYTGYDWQSTEVAVGWVMRSIGAEEYYEFLSLPCYVDSRDYLLSVSSEYGSPVPAVGLYTNAWGAFISGTVNQFHVEQGVKWSCTGWTAVGVDKASGVTTNTGALQLLETDSQLTWLWEPSAYWVDVSVQGTGDVSVDDDWYDVGANLDLTASGTSGWLFTGWSGDIIGGYTSNPTNILVDSPKTIVAHFSDDADGDGILNTNEVAYGTNPRKSDSDGDGLTDPEELFTYSTNPNNSDMDSDGLSDGEELLTYNTNPELADTDADGFSDGFEVNTGFDPALDTSSPDLVSEILTAIEFQFNAANGVSYRIEATDDLIQGWEIIETNIMGQGNTIKRLYSIEGQSNRFFRARRN